MALNKPIKYTIIIVGIIIIIAATSIGSLLIYTKIILKKDSSTQIIDNSPLTKKFDEEDIDIELKWDDNTMFYKIYFRNEYFQTIDRTRQDEDYHITLQFKDKEYFEVSNLKINKTKLVKMGLGNFSFYKFEGNVKMERSLFQKIENKDMYSNFLFKK